MERCKYCGGEGGHGAGCPAAARQEGSAERKEIAGFAPREARAIVQVVDGVPPRELRARMTPEALAEILEWYLDDSRERREGMNEFPEDMPPSDVYLELSDRQSHTSHAIQCSVSKVADYGALARHLDRSASRYPRAASEDVRTVKEFAERQVELNRLMNGLFRIDIGLRYAALTRDVRYEERALRDIDALKKGIVAALDRYAETNAAFLGAREDLRARIATLRSALADADPASFRRRFYEDACKSLSEAIGSDADDFHYEEIMERLKRIERTAE